MNHAGWGKATTHEYHINLHNKILVSKTGWVNTEHFVQQTQQNKQDRTKNIWLRVTPHLFYPTHQWNPTPQLMHPEWQVSSTQSLSLGYQTSFFLCHTNGWNVLPPEKKSNNRNVLPPEKNNSKKSHLQHVCSLYKWSNIPVLKPEKFFKPQVSSVNPACNHPRKPAFHSRGGSPCTSKNNFCRSGGGT